MEKGLKRLSAAIACLCLLGCSTIEERRIAFIRGACPESMGAGSPEWVKCFAEASARFDMASGPGPMGPRAGRDWGRY
jgi:hypothetical protein